MPDEDHDRMNQLREAGRHADALALGDSLVARMQRLYANDPGALYGFYMDCGLAAYSANRMPRAVELFRSALALAEAAFGPDHPSLGTPLFNISMALPAGREALAVAIRCVRVQRGDPGFDPHEMAKFLERLGELHLHVNELKPARAAFTEALAKRDSTGPGDPRSMVALARLARLTKLDGDLPAARTLYERAVEVAERAHGPASVQAGFAHDNLATLLDVAKDYPAALASSERALAILTRALGSNHEDVGLCLNNQALILKGMGRGQEAAEALRKALLVHDWNGGREDINLATLLDNLSRLEHESGAFQEARKHALRALAIFEEVAGPDHLDTAICWSNLGHTELKLGDEKAARVAFERALEARRKLHGEGHPEVALLTEILAHLRAPDPKERHALFLQACREVFRDGVVEDRENVLLQVLMAVLRVSADEARELGLQARREAREKRLPSARITGREIYERALALVGDEAGSEKMKPRLAALRKVLGLP